MALIFFHVTFLCQQFSKLSLSPSPRSFSGLFHFLLFRPFYGWKGLTAEKKGSHLFTSPQMWPILWISLLRETYRPPHPHEKEFITRIRKLFTLTFGILTENVLNEQFSPEINWVSRKLWSSGKVDQLELNISCYLFFFCSSFASSIAQPAAWRQLLFDWVWKKDAKTSSVCEHTT